MELERRPRRLWAAASVSHTNIIELAKYIYCTACWMFKEDFVFYNQYTVVTPAEFYSSFFLLWFSYTPPPLPHPPPHSSPHTHQSLDSKRKISRLKLWQRNKWMWQLGDTDRGWGEGRRRGGGSLRGTHTLYNRVLKMNGNNNESDTWIKVTQR